ncbi:MAG: lytic transglycosylase domain-containing protein [Candidatus Neomarinimicrobiota bacterium]
MPSKGDKWLHEIDAELHAQQVPLPPELIAALVHVESRGVAGATNQSSGASGLLQVMPGTLEWYNKYHASVPLEYLRSSQHGREQLRVGIWVLSQFWKSAYRYLRKRQKTIPVEQLAEIADLFYVAGPGATTKRLDQVEPATRSALEDRFPGWNALPHPRNVFELGPFPFELDAISKWLESGYLSRRKSEQIGALAALLLFWLVGKYFNSGVKSNAGVD